MNKLAKSLLSAVGLSAASVAFAQQSINYNFNVSSADFTSSFSNTAGAVLPAGAAGTNNWFGTAGVGNSGHINNNGTQPSLVYNTPISTAGIDTFTTSAFVRSSALVAGAGGSFFHLGFVDNVGGNLRSEESVSNQMSLRFVGTATPGELTWFTRTNTPTTNAVNTAVAGSTAFTLAANSWYKFETTFTKGVASTWNFTASVTPFGTDGLSEGTALSSASGTIVQAALYDATTIYGAVMYRGGGGFGPNLALLDNYSIVTSAIPEPSSFAALAGLAVLGLVTLRRRRSL